MAAVLVMGPAIAISATVKAPVLGSINSSRQVIVSPVEIVTVSIVVLVLVPVIGVLVSEIAVGAPPVPVQAPESVPVPVIIESVRVDAFGG